MQIDAVHAVLHTTSALDGSARRHRSWFTIDRADVERTTVYLYAAISSAGEEPAWVTNLRVRPDAAIEFDGQTDGQTDAGTDDGSTGPGGPTSCTGATFGAVARLDADIDELERLRAMHLLRAKYAGRLRNPLRVDPGTGVLVALDLR